MITLPKPIRVSLGAVTSNSSFYVPLLIVIGCIFIFSVSRSHDDPQIPLVGRKSNFEPSWSVGFRFMHNASSIVQDGYTKVPTAVALNLLKISKLTTIKFKDRVFRIRRIDGDIFIIPPENLEQLRNAPPDEVNGLEAHIKNLFGPYSTTDMMLDGDLPTRVIQQKLTPGLLSVVPIMKDEIEHALRVEVPDCYGKAL